MYNDFYNFSISPFENTPDPRFLTLTPLYREVLSSLIYGVNAGKGFMLLSGEAGTGKTTLIRAFLQEIDQKHLILNIINPQNSFDDLVLQLARKLGRDCQGLSSMAAVEALEDALKQYTVDGRKVVIVIDEAHLLTERSLEDIRLLSNIEDNHQKLIQIILAGQNEISKLLAQPSQKSLRQRINISRKLQTMSPAEVHHYINHRLLTANGHGEIFEKESIALIAKKSHGIARIVNQICDNALLIGYASNARNINKSIISEVVNDMHPVGFSPIHMPTWFSQRWLWIIPVFPLLVLLNIFFYQSQKKAEPPQARTAQQETINTKPIVPVTDTTSTQPKSRAITAEPLSSVTQEIPPPMAKPDTIVTIRTGQDIRSLAIEQYGCATETLFELIQAANPQLTSIDHIYVGQQLRFPTITRNSLLHHNLDGRINIHYASFFNKRTAERVSQKFITKGWHAEVHSIQYYSTTYYRVLLGTFSEQSTAHAKLAEIDFKNLPFLQQPL